MSEEEGMIPLSMEYPIWERFFLVHPLVIVGTVEEDGRPDFAPKHMAMPMSWENWFGFVCAPTHATSRNARRMGVFTVSYPPPDEVLLATLSATPRDDGGGKPMLSMVPHHRAEVVDGYTVAQCPLVLECEVDRVVDGLGANCLILGRIVAARAAPHILRVMDRDDNALLQNHPPLVYLQPGRFGAVSRSLSFPYPKGFCR